LLLESAGITFMYRRDERALPAEIETCLALTLREAVTNIQRHARATRAQVEFTFAEGGVHMCVSDDGRGGIGAHGNGLTGMRERIEAMAGTLSIESRRGRGTKLEIMLPVAFAPPAKVVVNEAPSALPVTTLRHA
jgi:two-component system sensor histidine kinase DesK